MKINKKRFFKKLVLITPITLIATLLIKKQQKKEVNNLQVTQVDVQNSIDKCTQIAQKIRTIANDVTDHRARYALAEADRHIEMSIHGCFDAKSITKA